MRNKRTDLFRDVVANAHGWATQIKDGDVRLALSDGHKPENILACLEISKESAVSLIGSLVDFYGLTRFDIEDELDFRRERFKSKSAQDSRGGYDE